MQVVEFKSNMRLSKNVLVFKKKCYKINNNNQDHKKQQNSNQKTKNLSTYAMNKTSLKKISFMFHQLR